MNNIERKKFLSKIARLYYSEGLTQQEIAYRLNISRTKVSRYLERARKDGIVEIKINLPEEDYSNLEYGIEKSFRIRNALLCPLLRIRKKY